MGQYDFYSKVAAYLKKEKKGKPSSAIIMVMPQSRSMAPQDVAPTDSRSYASQPDMTQPAGVVHPKEGVLSARAMQNIGDDTFTALSHKAEDGTLDLNLLRSAAGLSQLPGYASGGIADTQGTVAVKDPIVATNDPKLNMLSVTRTPDMPIYSKPIPDSYATVATPATKTVVNPSLGNLVVGKPGTTAVANSTPIPTADDTTRTLSTQYLTDVMNNKNPLQKNIASQTLGDLSARQQYSNAALNQTMGQNQNLTEGAKSTLTAEQQAQQSAELAKTEGTLATNAQTQAINAAGTLYSGSLAGQQLAQTGKLTQEQIDLSAKNSNTALQQDAYVKAVAAGDFKSAAVAYKNLTGQDLSTTQYQTDLSNKNLSTDMTNMTSYAQSGINVDDMIKDMENRGLLDPNDASRIASIKSAYSAIEQSTNPIMKISNEVNSLPDSLVNNMFSNDSTMSGKTLAEKRAAIVQLMTVGATPTATTYAPGQDVSTAISYSPGSVNAQAQQTGNMRKFNTAPPSVGSYIAINTGAGFDKKTTAYQVTSAVSNQPNYNNSEGFTAIDMSDPAHPKQVLIVAGYGVVSGTGREQSDSGYNVEQ